MVNIGIVGTGIFARDNHAPAIKSLDGLTIVSAYNRTKAKAQDFADAAGVPKVHDSVDELIADPSVQAIDALLPVQHNLDIVTRAVRASKPIALEKPISSNIADARAIVELARSTKVPVMVLENVAYSPVIPVLRSLLPKIGRVATFEFHVVGPYAASKYHATAWRQKPEHVGGYLSDGGVHHVALLTGVLGPVEAVSARTTWIKGDISGDVDTLTSLLHMQDGSFGTFSYGSYLGATKRETKLTIWGTHGSIIYTNSPGSGPSVVYQTGEGVADASEVQTVDVPEEQHGGVAAEFANFRDAVEAGDKTLLQCTPEHAFHHFAVIVAAVTSGQEGGKFTKVEVV